MSDHGDSDREQVNEEDQELVTIENLSQKLENLYKLMEQKRRENVLFESYLHRNAKTFLDEEADERKGKGKNKRGGEKLELTNEEKYEIANAESEALKKNIDECRLRSDSVLEALRAILEETDMAITEIRKDAFDFQREILIGGENSRTGKIEAERIIRYRENKLRQKDALIEKYRAKIATLESQIIKTENQIKKKEEMGDDLKFIDFHQLQIENKKYVKEITEKNNKLLELKKATGKIVIKLTKERKTLNDEMEKRMKLTAALSDKADNITKLKEEIKGVEKEITDEGDLKKKLEKQKEDNQDIPQIMDYIKRKERGEERKYQIKNLQRKIEIAELPFRQAMKFLKDRGYTVQPFESFKPRDDGKDSDDSN